MGNKQIIGLVITGLLVLPLASANGNVGGTPTTGTTSTIGTTDTSQDEATSIKKEIEALKVKSNQTSDEYEKNIITNKIEELTKKLESLNRATSPLPEISTDLSPQIKAQNITATITDNFTTLVINVPDAKGWTWSVIWDGGVHKYDITSFPYKTSTGWAANKEIQLYATNSLGHWGYSALFTPTLGNDGKTPSSGTSEDEATSIKKEIEALRAKYNQTKDAKEKDSITKRIAELTKKLESLNQTPTLGNDGKTPSSGTSEDEATSIKKEIEALRAKYNQTKDAKEKDSITKKIAELTKKLESLNIAQRINDIDAEEASIVKEIEALRAMYDQTTDTIEKDSINSQITESKKKLEILQGEEEVKGRIVSLINAINKEEQSVISINASIKKLQAEYNATKTAKGKKAINANIAKLKKQKDNVTKKITELTIELKQAKTKIVLDGQSE